MTEGVRAAAYDLHQALAATPLPLPLTGSQTLREQRAGLLDQLGDHLLPRLDQPDRPILVVVGGPTGVGKSTLVNTVVGQQVTTSGLARPTTRSPVLVHHPDDELTAGSVDGPAVSAAAGAAEQRGEVVATQCRRTISKVLRGRVIAPVNAELATLARFRAGLHAASLGAEPGTSRISRE